MPVRKRKTPGPGRPKDMDKHAAILAAAKALFAQHGFRGASMDKVAARAGVSKLTVYGHFGDKDRLFRAVVHEWMQEHLPESTYRLDPGQDIRSNLLRVARAHAHLDCATDTLHTLRTVLGDCKQGIPRYGQTMWNEGIERTDRLIGGLLRDATAAGLLHVDDVPRATLQFLSLARSELMLRSLFGCTAIAGDEAALDAHAAAAVDAFLHIYGGAAH